MKRKIRRTLFFLCCLVFFLIAPALTYYAIGYRIDWKNKTITYVGGISISTSPQGAKIYLNGKFIKESTPIWSPDVYIKNLAPKSYRVKVEKDGYRPWEKTLEVLPKSVTKAEFIVLFKQQPDILTIFENTSAIWQADSGKKLALLEPMENGAQRFNLLDISQNNAENIIKLDMPYIDSFDVISWNSQESAVIIFDKYNNKYFLVDFYRKSVDVLPSRLFMDSEPVSMSAPQFNKWNGEELVFLDNHTLYRYHLVFKQVREMARNISAWAFGDNVMYYIKNDGILYKNVQDFSGEAPLSVFPIPSFRGFTRYVILESRRPISGIPHIAVLQQDDEKILFLLNGENGSFHTIEKGVEGIRFSWDLKKLLVYTKSKAIVHYLQSIVTQPHHDKGDKETVFESDSAIGKIFWLVQWEHYIAVAIGNTISIIELDGRDKRNVTDFIVADDLRNMFFFGNEKAIYFHDGNAIKKAVFSY